MGIGNGINPLDLVPRIVEGVFCVRLLVVEEWMDFVIGAEGTEEDILSMKRNRCYSGINLLEFLLDSAWSVLDNAEATTNFINTGTRIMKRLQDQAQSLRKAVNERNLRAKGKVDLFLDDKDEDPVAATSEKIRGLSEKFSRRCTS